MEYRLQTPLQSELPDGRVGINARVFRISDNVEVGKFLHIAADQDAAEAFIAAISEQITVHPSFIPNENF
jgi:ribosomal 50S subunit-recycling heat shock protein